MQVSRWGNSLAVRLPAKFAAKLYKVTELGTPVLIGA